MKQKYKRVYVEWLDSCRFHNWLDPEVPIESKLTKIQSTAWLIYKNKKKIIIAHSHDPLNGNICGIMEIPRVAIEKLEVMK